MVLPNITNRIKLGLTLIYLAGVGWIAELILPFFHFGHKATVLIVNFTIAEIAFLVGATLVGKTAYENIKAKLLELTQRRKQP